MLLYRPILLAYERAESAPIRRYLLRVLAHPHLHSEPDESLATIRRAPQDSVVTEAGRLATELSLCDQFLKKHLTSGDPGCDNAGEGMWTMVSRSRIFVGWNRHSSRAASLSQAASSSLLPIGQALLRDSDEPARAWVLGSLGDLGQAETLGVLADEITGGQMPGPAAVGLGRMGGEEAGAVLFKALQGRGLEKCSNWAGIALSGLAQKENVPLLLRMARAPQQEVREAAATALESFGDFDVESLMEAFAPEQNQFVRLNLLLSISRLSRPIPMSMVRNFVRPGDPDLLRSLGMRAAGRVGDYEAREYLEQGVLEGGPADKADALEALVSMGAPGERVMPEVRKAASAFQGRLSLAALLAMSVWDPQECFTHVVKYFQTSSAAQWMVGTYVLRYLRTDQTASLLFQVAKLVKGLDLEEVVVRALARHIDRPLVVETLLSRIGANTRPMIAQRILMDIGQMGKLEHSALAANHLRGLLDKGVDPRLEGSLLTGLGALGGKQDLPRLTSRIESPAAVGAIRGIELLTDQSAESELSAAASGGPMEVREAAIVAMFRLGLFEGERQLAEMVASRRTEMVMSAARILPQLMLSVRSVTSVARLVLLRAALETRLGEPEEPEEPASVPVSPISRLAAPDGMEAVLVRSRATIKTVAKPQIAREAPQDSNRPFYMELGTHLLGRGMGEQGGARWAISGVILLTLVFYMMHVVFGGSATETPSPRPSKKKTQKKVVQTTAGTAPTAASPGPSPTVSASASSVVTGAVSVSAGADLEIRGEIVSIKDGRVTVRSQGQIYILEGEATGSLRTGEVFQGRRSVSRIDPLGFVYLK
jgi:hypothetical protein